MTLGGSDGGDELDWLRGELSAIRRELLPAAESRALTLALDQGGQSSRAVLYDAVGREVASAHVPIATRHDCDRVEHDADELVRSLLEAAHDACSSPQAAGRPIAAVGLATQRSTVCCWDSVDGAALAPALSWQDRRHARWLEEHLGAQAGWIRELTGLPLSPHYGASKLRWCLDQLPAVRLALRDGRLSFGPLASFLLHRLCRERPSLADPANASRTLLYDPALLDWSPALLEAFGLPRECLPRCVGTEHGFGTLALEGLRPAPLRACSGDQSAAIYALGAPAVTTAYVNAGTGAFVQRIVPDPGVAAPRGLLRSVVHADPDHAAGATSCHEGTVNGGQAAVEWLRGRVGFDVARALPTLASHVPPEHVSVLFMNGVGGLGAPYWRPDFRVEFVALDGSSIDDSTVDDAGRLAAVVDSIAFLLAVNLQAMRRVAPLQRVVITGGLAGCDYLCEVLAEVTGLAVERPALREATARGIAYLAAGQPAQWQPVPVERRFTPQGRAAIVQRYERWRMEIERRVDATGSGS